MKNKHRKYSHIKSYKDIQTELEQLGFLSRISKKEIEIQSLHLKHDIHPVRLFPSLIAQWATPMMFEMRDQLFNLILKLISTPGEKK